MACARATSSGCDSSGEHVRQRTADLSSAPPGRVRERERDHIACVVCELGDDRSTPTDVVDKIEMQHKNLKGPASC